MRKKERTKEETSVIKSLSMLLIKDLRESDLWPERNFEWRFKSSRKLISIGKESSSKVTKRKTDKQGQNWMEPKAESHRSVRTSLMFNKIKLNNCWIKSGPSSYKPKALSLNQTQRIKSSRSLKSQFWKARSINLKSSYSKIKSIFRAENCLLMKKYWSKANSLWTRR